MLRITATSLAALALFVAACETTSNQPADTASAATQVAAPLHADNAYEIAGAQTLPEKAPQEGPGLKNLFWLSDNILSGSEPHGEAALKRLSELGIKTILSTDGKTPDADTAAKYGIRYVHVPIKYSGVSRGQMLRIAKTFRELEGPFYTHCFHGKHRGPTGAAIGRLVLDGQSREHTLEEMRQYCGVGKSYPGLYAAIANDEIPSADETAAFDWDFPSAHPLRGFRSAMIVAPRAHDNLALLAKRNWAPDPDHPDLDAVNEAAKLRQTFEAAAAMDEVQKRPEDFRTWLTETVKWSRELHESLQAAATEGDAARTRAGTALGEIKKRCAACHKSYRNH